MTINLSNNQPGGIFLLMEDYHRIYTDAAAVAAKRESYDALAARLFSQGYYYGDSYLKAFAKEGIAARQSVPDCLPLQSRWARESGLKFTPLWLDKIYLRGAARRIFRLNVHSREERLARIVTEQIKRARPRVVWVFSGVPVSRKLLDEWRQYADKIYLWHSCPVWSAYPYHGFDAIFTCIPSLVDYFRAQGIKSYLLGHSFDPDIFKRVAPARERKHRLVFVGSLGGLHQERTEFLDKLSRQVDIDFYGPSCNGIPKDSPLRKNYKGPAWGAQLYAVYGSYLAAIHMNIEIADHFPTAKRIFEATGMGCALVTHEHEHLKRLFEPDKEIVPFANFYDCRDKVHALLTNPPAAEAIGRWAQARVLKEHTYEQRVKEFLNYCRKDLKINI